MIQMKEKIENLLQIFQGQQSFQTLFDQRLFYIKKTLFVSNISPLYVIIKPMTMCLIFDYLLAKIVPQGKQLQIMNQLRTKKQLLVTKIKQDLAILIMQGKLKQYSKSDTLQIVVVKLCCDLLNRIKIKQEINEQVLFQRLNYILVGVNITSKCYKLSLNRVNNNIILQKQKQQKQQSEQKQAGSRKQNSQFSKIFGIQKNIRNEQKKNSIGKKLYIHTDNNKKIQNMINKVKQTIQTQSKKFQYFGCDKQLKKNLITKKKKDGNQNLSFQQHHKQPQGRQMIDLRENMNRLKRSDSINENQRVHFNVQSISKPPSSIFNTEDEPTSFQSIPYTYQNWYQPQNTIRIKKVYSVNISKLTNSKYR